MPKKIKVSIVTVVYNDINNLQHTINSVERQKYPEVEYIVIDGGSTDGTLELIKENEHIVDKWVSEKDAGIYDAMNKGIVLASGQYINFMNSGDVFYDDNVLDELFSAIDKESQPDLIYGNHSVLYPSGKTIIRKANLVKRKTYLFKMPCCHQSLFASKYICSLFPFDLSYKLAADFNFVMSAVNHGVSMFYYDKTVSLVSAEGASDLKRRDVWKEYNQICNTYSKGRCYKLILKVYFRFKIILEIIKSWIKKNIK